MSRVQTAIQSALIMYSIAAVIAMVMAGMIKLLFAAIRFRRSAPNDR